MAQCQLLRWIGVTFEAFALLRMLPLDFVFQNCSQYWDVLCVVNLFKTWEMDGSIVIIWKRCRANKGIGSADATHWQRQQRVCSIDSRCSNRCFNSWIFWGFFGDFLGIFWDSLRAGGQFAMSQKATGEVQLEKKKTLKDDLWRWTESTSHFLATIYSKSVFLKVIYGI